MQGVIHSKVKARFQLHIHTYIHTYIHAGSGTVRFQLYIHTYIHSYIRAERHSTKVCILSHIHTYIHTCIHAYMQDVIQLKGLFSTIAGMSVRHMHKCMHVACMNVCVTAFVLVHMYVCVYVYIYIYVHTHTLSLTYTAVNIHTYIHTCVDAHKQMYIQELKPIPVLARAEPLHLLT